MSGRITIREPLVVELSWNGEVFHFRLMVGHRFATPRLPIDALGMLKLEQGEKVALADKALNTWVILGSNRRIIKIWFEGFRACRVKADALIEWPEIDYGHFMAVAQIERGAAPSEGWEAVIEANMDAKRTG